MSAGHIDNNFDKIKVVKDKRGGIDNRALDIGVEIVSGDNKPDDQKDSLDQKGFTSPGFVKQGYIIGATPFYEDKDSENHDPSIGDNLDSGNPSKEESSGYWVYGGIVRKDEETNRYYLVKGNSEEGEYIASLEPNFEFAGIDPAYNDMIPGGLQRLSVSNGEVLGLANIALAKFKEKSSVIGVTDEGKPVLLRTILNPGEENKKEFTKSDAQQVAKVIQDMLTGLASGELDITGAASFAQEGIKGILDKDTFMSAGIEIGAPPKGLGGLAISDLGSYHLQNGVYSTKFKDGAKGFISTAAFACGNPDHSSEDGIKGAHIDTNAAFFAESQFDGPLAFSNSFYKGAGGGNYKYKVHLVFDTKKKVWRWYADGNRKPPTTNIGKGGGTEDAPDKPMHQDDISYHAPPGPTTFMRPKPAPKGVNRFPKWKHKNAKRAPATGGLTQGEIGSGISKGSNSEDDYFDLGEMFKKAAGFVPWGNPSKKVDGFGVGATGYGSQIKPYWFGDKETPSGLIHGSGRSSDEKAGKKNANKDVTGTPGTGVQAPKDSAANKSPIPPVKPKAGGGAAPAEVDETGSSSFHFIARQPGINSPSSYGGNANYGSAPTSPEPYSDLLKATNEAASDGKPLALEANSGTYDIDKKHRDIIPGVDAPSDTADPYDKAEIGAFHAVCDTNKDGSLDTESLDGRSMPQPANGSKVIFAPADVDPQTENGTGTSIADLCIHATRAKLTFGTSEDLSALFQIQTIGGLDYLVIDATAIDGIKLKGPTTTTTIN